MVCATHRHRDGIRATHHHHEVGATHRRDADPTDDPHPRHNDADDPHHHHHDEDPTGDPHPRHTDADDPHHHHHDEDCATHRHHVICATHRRDADPMDGRNSDDPSHHQHRNDPPDGPSHPQDAPRTDGLTHHWGGRHLREHSGDDQNSDARAFPRGYGQLGPEMRKTPDRERSGVFLRLIPAATYSPRGSTPKYHRRWRA